MACLNGSESLHPYVSFAHTVTCIGFPQCIIEE